jgi:O-antigen ligase
MNFGLSHVVPYVEYLIFIVSVFLTVFWRPVVGIFFLLPLIPLQTIRYRLNDFPLGGSVVGIMLFAIVLGVLWRGDPVLPRTPWTRLLCLYAFFTFFSLCLGSYYLGGSLALPWNDPRFGVWQDYMTMPALLLLTVAVHPTSRQMKAIILLMCLATWVLDHNFWSAASGRDYSTYSDDLREGSSMGYAGSNGLAAFEAQVTMFLLALGALEKKFWLRLGYRALAVFSAVCVIYSLSRGGYVALLAGCLFLGLVRQRSLLVLLIVALFTWTSLMPPAAQQRILTSYDTESGSVDHSAETRLELWQDALELFRASPAMGTGFNTYAYMHRHKRTDGGEGYYEDTHNFYLKVLVETGVTGLLIFLWLLVKMFVTGYRLFIRSKDPFRASLGLGLAAWVICAAAANFFGDRWTFLQVNGYMWVLAGLVVRAWILDQADPQPSTTTESNGTWSAVEAVGQPS